MSLMGLRNAEDEIKGLSDFIGRIFRSHGSELIRSQKLATEISSLIDTLGLFIKRHTETVCPRCLNVCCINRHSRYAYDDIVYLSALDEQMIPRKKDISDTARCQFLGEKGCVIKHSLRPYRCTWYFCPALLEQIELDPVREYKRFIELLQQITRKRVYLLDAFAGVVKIAGFDLEGNSEDGKEASDK